MLNWINLKYMRGKGDAEAMFIAKLGLIIPKVAVSYSEAMLGKITA